jgi:MoaA/NifB/PqqE/SkfB family radical SAM enzyme
LNIIRMASSFLSPYQPSFLVLFITSRCNAKCSFCFYSDSLAGEQGSLSDMSTKEFSSLSEKCGRIPYLLLSGGEPVLRDDVTEIADAFIDNAGARYVTIPSNGLSPGRLYESFEKMTRDHPDVHFRSALSIDYQDGRHDRIRGVPGCLESVVKSAESIRELKRERTNLSLDVVTVFLPDEGQDHGEIRNWVRENIKPDNHELHLMREGWPDPIPGEMNLDRFLTEAAEYVRLGRRREQRYLSPFFRGLNDVYVSSLKRLVRGDRISKCFAGRKIVVVSEKGDVRLCEFRPDVLGNLREHDYDLTAILKNSRDLFRRMNREKCTCTWECAVSTNIVSSLRFWPRLLVSVIRETFKGRNR